MRLRVWLFGGAVLAVCALLLLLRVKQNRLPAAGRGLVIETNNPSQTQWQQKHPEQTQATNAAQITAVLPPMTPLAEAVAKTNPEAAMLLRMWQAPIEFYGKVIDEQSNAVEGADIRFRWSELPEKGGERTSDTQSDSVGLFSLHGKRGRSLTVWYSKKGYYSSQGGELAFNYALGPDTLSPDPRNPVIFRLRKEGKGESLISTEFPGFAHIAQLRHDGTPLEVDLLKGESVQPGSGQLRIEFWRDLSSKNATTFDWRYQLTVPGGGLVQSDQEFAFEAPSEGYSPSLTFGMQATNQDWQDDLTSKYYVHLPDGKYGRVDVHLLAYNGVITIQSVINPTGSRNLEPAQ